MLLVNDINYFFFFSLGEPMMEPIHSTTDYCPPKDWLTLRMQVMDMANLHLEVVVSTFISKTVPPKYTFSKMIHKFKACFWN